MKAYLLAVAAAALLCSFVQSLVPDGSARRAISLAAGLLAAIVILRPIMTLHTDDVAAAIGRGIMSGEIARTQIETDNREAVAAIIKEKCEAYIWDKAEREGVAVQSIEVTLTGDGAYPAPDSAVIVGKYTKNQRESVTDWVEANLAIPEERQSWTWN
ncbi:MAG: stage III sporulation protein AF [Oscillospiraceae bacterium]|nr:stage III sporulation protein AF [Oscillospiraceae bacterium]